MVFAGFNRRKRGTVNRGDWDRDGVRNMKDCEPLNFRKQDAKCSGCGKEVAPIDMFSGNRCVDCFEKDYDKELKRTGNMPKPDFAGAVR